MIPKIDIVILGMLFLIALVVLYTITNINTFMKDLKTCNDDFILVDKCGCVPCSWKNAEKINHNICIDLSNYTADP